MLRLAVPSLGAVVVMGLWIFAVLDVIQTDEILARNLPKMMWLLLVIFVPLVGSLAWLIAGRPLYAGWSPGGAEGRRPAARLAPEDRPDWNPGRTVPSASEASALQRWEDDLARRERELRDREQGDLGEAKHELSPGDETPELGPGD